jgi:hypothetical protein
MKLFIGSSLRDNLYNKLLFRLSRSNTISHTPSIFYVSYLFVFLKIGSNQTKYDM